MFAFRREILMCPDKSETFKIEDENDYENESLKVFPRLLKNYTPGKLHYTILIRKVSVRLFLLKKVKSSVPPMVKKPKLLTFDIVFSRL